MLIPACDDHAVSAGGTAPTVPGVGSARPTSFDNAMVGLGRKSSTTFALEERPAVSHNSGTDSTTDEARAKAWKERLEKMLSEMPQEAPPNGAPTDIPDSKVRSNLAEQTGDGALPGI